MKTGYRRNHTQIRTFIDHCQIRVDEHHPRRRAVYTSNTNRKFRAVIVTDVLGMAKQAESWTSSCRPRGLEEQQLDAVDTRQNPKWLTVPGIEYGMNCRQVRQLPRMNMEDEYCPPYKVKKAHSQPNLAILWPIDARTHCVLDVAEARLWGV